MGVSFDLTRTVSLRVEWPLVQMMMVVDEGVNSRHPGFVKSTEWVVAVPGVWR